MIDTSYMYWTVADIQRECRIGRGTVYKVVEAAGVGETYKNRILVRDDNMDRVIAEVERRKTFDSSIGQADPELAIEHKKAHDTRHSKDKRHRKALSDYEALIGWKLRMKEKHNGR